MLAGGTGDIGITRLHTLVVPIAASVVMADELVFFAGRVRSGVFTWRAERIWYFVGIHHVED